MDEAKQPPNETLKVGPGYSFKDRLKGAYFRFFRGIMSGDASIVRLPMGELQKRVDWSQGLGSGITTIPEYPEDLIEVLDLYPVTENLTYVQVILDKENAETRLIVLEPTLTDDEKVLLARIKDTLQRTLNYDWERLSKMDKEVYIIQSVQSFLESRGIEITPVTKTRINYYIVRDFIGYGPIDVLTKDDHVEDISCDGNRSNIFVYHGKFESVKTSVRFDVEEELDSFIIFLGQTCGRQITVSEPLLDGTTPEGHRVQATYSDEVTAHGSTFTIRRFKDRPLTPTDLVRYHTASAEMMAYFWMAVENGESMLICGGTGAGKTSTLNVVSLFIPPGAKIVTLEDTREINLPHENWIPSVTRAGSGDDQGEEKMPGEIDMYDLMRAALRQRPNYIIVGEVRGKETYTMFQAMATGHTTYSTMHADSVKSMVSRLENPPINCPRIMLTALRNVIIQSPARVGKDMVRRIKEVVEIVGFEPDTNEIITNTVFEWDQALDTFHYRGHSFMFDKLVETKNITHEDMAQEFQRRVDIINYMEKKEMTDHRQIWSLINRYYNEPDKVMKIVWKRLGKKGVARVT
ncbi:MAG: type II/IV secretion system ATPase subunit [Candidatus Methanomethylophilaceae archaeon]|nr:type II/IV secretion system ATPase subunit [Candidatus Methanomethylophilaceae archaeon]